MTHEMTRGMLTAAVTATLMGLAASPAAAAEPAPETRTVGLGIGATVGTNGLTGLGLSDATIAVPIRLGPNWRLEPRFRGSYYVADNNGGLGALSGGRGGGTDSLSLQLASDLHHLWPVSEQTFAYAGLRAGAGYSETESEGAEFGRRRNEYFNLEAGPVLGGEYLFSDTFSMGVEASALYAHVTRSFESDNDSSDDDWETSMNNVRTTATIFARVYLW